MSAAPGMRMANRLENFFLPGRLISASADARAVRITMICKAFCSRLSADEATAEAAKSAILTRFESQAQGFSLISQGFPVHAQECRQRSDCAINKNIFIFNYLQNTRTDGMHHTLWVCVACQTAIIPPSTGSMCPVT